MEVEPRSASAFFSPDGVLDRYAHSLPRGWPWLLGAGLFLIGFGVVVRRRLPERLSQRLGLGVVALLVVFASIYAWHLRWLCDDAFISFRYADNWASGDGLVYNVGERVEGYTNFLWTALLTVGILLGIEPGHLALVLSLACLAGALVVPTLLARRLLPETARLPGILCSAGLASSYVFASFGTSGLETMAAALLVLVAVERAEAKSPLVAGTAGIVATLMHPDHIVFYVVLGAVLAISPVPRMPRLIRYFAPFVCIFLPYFFARFAYYGEAFPNTYYAKSGGSFYWSQGLVYLAMGALIAGLVAVLPLAGFGVYLARKTVFARFTALGVPLYLGYVVKVGGDFMLGRLLVSVLPLVFLAAEIGVRGLLERPRWAYGALSLALFVPVALPNGVVKPGEKYLDIADERTFYPLKRFEPITVETSYMTQAKKLRRIFRNAPRPPKIGIGAIGIVGYFTRFPIGDTLGLVNRDVAHMKIRTRGRPGHEKVATPGHVFGFGVDFTDLALWPKEYGSWTQFHVDTTDYWLVQYDPRLAASLRELRLPDIEGRIRVYDPAERPSDKRACDLWFFDLVYFSHEKNEPLRSRLAAAVARADPSLAGLDELLVGPLPASGKGWQARRLFSFDDVAGWSKTGEAFSRPPSDEEVPGQERVFGATGRFVSSFVPKIGDGSRGSLRSPKFVLSGDALTLLVGGGRSRRVQVRLLVDDESVATATGCECDSLGRRVFPIGAYRGQKAELEILDRGEKGWEHVIVDEVVEWRRTP